MADEQKTTRRWLVSRSATVAGAAGGASLLAACGTQAEPSGPKTISGPKVLGYATTNDVSLPEYKEYNQVFSDRFGGDVQVEGINIAAGEFVPKILSLHVAGSLPDIVQSTMPNFPALARAGAYKPVTSYLSKDKSMPAKDFFAGHVNAFTWKGELMGLTGGLVDRNVIFVNKRVFGENGVKVPTPQESQNFTWNNVVDLARRMTKSDGSQFGLYLSSFLAVPYSGGAYVVDNRENATRGALDDPRWARSVEYWADWAQKQRVMGAAAELAGLGEPNWTQAWARGKVAMMHEVSTQVSFALRAEPSLQWDMIWVPKLAADQPRKFFTGGAGWGMTPRVRNADLGWEWIKFIDRKPGSYEISLKHNAPTAIYLSSHIPTTQKELDRLKKMGVANADLLVAGANDLLWPPLHPEWPRIDSQIITPELAKMQRGEVAANALRDLNDRVTRELRAG